VTGLQQLRSLSSLTHLSLDAVSRPPLPGNLLQLALIVNHNALVALWRLQTTCTRHSI
jgi:hypothetical protein